jgi:hypothetical protein
MAERIDEIRRAAGQDAVAAELDAADRERLAGAVTRLAARLTRPGHG